MASELSFFDVAAIIIAVITAIGVSVTSFMLSTQILHSKRIAEADIILRLHNDFFYRNPNAEIIQAIEEDEPIFKKNGGKFTEKHIDDYLGTILLLEKFVKNKLIKMEIVDDMFGYYIKKSLKNEEIKKYIKEIQQTVGSDYYKSMQELADKLE